MRWTKLVFVFAVSLAPVTSGAQLSQRDSLRYLDQAHSAQSSFESFRRQRLPRAEPYDHPCEFNVGRMCYWNDNDDDETAPLEPRSITAARQKLIATLDRLSALTRADDWIAAQRVRYLVEAGEDSTAVVAARECWSAKWWCSALLGYALHSGERYRDAEAAFDSAVAWMPEATRCRWTDISLLMDDDQREQYSKLPCDKRAAFEQRFWDLAQPSYAVQGNDRKTEHYSRELLADLYESSSNTYGLAWGDDLRELLIRYGDPTWYTTSPPRMGAIGGDFPSTSGHDRTPSYHFAPVAEGDSVHWDVRANQAPERYSPPYLDTLVDLDAQFAMMKRGDSALVIAVYGETSDSGKVVLGVSGRSPKMTEAVDTAATQVHVRRAKAAWKGIVAGVERYDPRTRRDARARVWLAPPTLAPDAPALSTLLLFAPDTSNVESLDDALAHALTRDELRGSRKLGLYWEMYGSVAAATPADSPAADTVLHQTPLHDSATGVQPKQDSVLRDSTPAQDSANAKPADPARVAVASAQVESGASHSPSDVSISVTRIDGGLLKWLGQTLHITPRDSPIAVQWHDARIGEGTSTRSVVLDLAQLPAGTYRVAVAVGPDAAHRSTTSREIRLR